MAADDPTADVPTPDSLEKIRDILFGEQVRANEKRVTSLSDQFGHQLTELRGDLLGRLRSLETFAREETASLGKRLGEQADAAEAARSQTAEELERLRADFDERLSRLARDHAEGLSSLRQQLLEQSQALRDEIAARVAELQASLAAGLAELRGAKVERSALSSLFADLAVRLSDADDDEILLGGTDGEVLELNDPAESAEPRRGQGAG